MSAAHRITLRQLCFDDWPRIHEWASTDAACRYQTWGPNTPEETRAFVRTEIDAWSRTPQTRYIWAAVAADAGVVGLGGLRRRDSGHATIDYAVHVQHWGEGIGTAIARLLVDYGFSRLGLHRIAGTCDPRNIGSARILTAVGMRYEGRLRQIIRLRDGWRDSNIYSILEEEWPNASSADASEGS